MLQTITTENFNAYGRILDLVLTELIACIEKRRQIQAGTVSYEPSVAEFEQLPIFAELSSSIFGGMPIELGHCSGWNHKLNGLEYHRSSEIDLAATDLILMVGKQQDINWQTMTYDTAKVECFKVPAGTAVELYATTLHFAPCSVGNTEFRMGVALLRGTNEDLDGKPDYSEEDKLLLGKNKWLLAHADSGLEKDGAWIGLRGKNLSL